MTKLGPILFSPSLLHKDVAAGMGKITSAGFVKLSFDVLGDILAECYGSSDSLGMSPAEGDEDMIEVILNLQIWTNQQFSTTKGKPLIATP